MPNLDFTLPHWAYWIGLIVFPIVAATLAKRPRPKERRYTTSLAYFIWLTGGILGLHRLYLKNLIGLLYIPVFLGILYANSEGQQARSTLSDLTNTVRQAERAINRETERVKTAEADLPGLRAALETVEQGSFAQRRAERNVQRAEQRLETGREIIAEAEADLAAAQPAVEIARQDQDFWNRFAASAFWLLIGGMIVDAVLLPALIRRANSTLSEDDLRSRSPAPAGEDTSDDDSRFVSSGWTGWIDRACLHCGEFVGYWAVIAVFVYYFEVMSRYVFGSPTNWAHEAMYLMFGMQYLIAGAYAMLTESHVRVDIFYSNWSARRKALVNILTSLFFFIFAGTLLVTSWIFAFDAIAVPSGNSLLSDWARGQISTGDMLANWSLDQWTDPNIRWGEISFNEWEVPLWPMKWVMVLGGLLLLAQGLSRLARDLRTLVTVRA